MIIGQYGFPLALPVCNNTNNKKKIKKERKENGQIASYSATLVSRKNVKVLYEYSKHITIKPFRTFWLLFVLK